MNEEVKALKSELMLLKLQFSERVGEVEKRLNDLITKEEWQAEHSQDDGNQFSTVQTHASQAAQPLHTIAQQKSSSPQQTASVSVSHHLAPKKKRASAPVEPSFIELFFKTLLSSFFDWLTPVTKIYQSYKARGMLGIFILTIVGIGLTLAGFGYLMQLLIDQLGAGSKSLLMCLVAILVMALGIGLKIKTRFGEFSTAIVTLGILLSYSTAYFSGSVYGLLPNVVILVLYLAIALLCHTLALWLDTKIVAALGIIGIATMPILSNTISIEPLYYLLSLAFVVSSSLFIAYRYVWSWLAQLSLAFALISLEWIVGIEGFSSTSISLVINLFYLRLFGVS